MKVHMRFQRRDPTYRADDAPFLSVFCHLFSVIYALTPETIKMTQTIRSVVKAS